MASRLCYSPGNDEDLVSMFLAPTRLVVVQLLSCAWVFVTPWTAALQASLSFIIPWSLLKLMSIVLVMSSNHLILCHSLLLLSSVFPSIRVFTNESARILEWVAIFFSEGSSWPRDQTWVSFITGRFFTIWATRTAHEASYKIHKSWFRNAHCF